MRHSCHVVAVQSGTLGPPHPANRRQVSRRDSGSTVLVYESALDSGWHEPIVAYDASGNRTYLIADERGSIMALSNSAGTVTAINAYDEYGVPKSDASGNNLNIGRFQYTGQAWLNEIGLYYFKNRFYSPTLGRFLQTDPTGESDGLNLYAYAHNDPANGSDPLGLGCESEQWGDPGTNGNCDEIVVTAFRIQSGFSDFGDLGGGEEIDSTPSLLTPNVPDSKCTTGLKQAKVDMNGVSRAKAAWNTIKAAATAAGIKPALLAAVGLRESDFGAPGKSHENDGAGVGVGVFQLTVSRGSGVTEAQAANLNTAAPIAAAHLAGDMGALSARFANFTPDQLLQATAAAYNMGLGKNFSNFSGNPNSIDVGTAHNNYGQSVVNMMTCFKGM